MQGDESIAYEATEAVLRAAMSYQEMSGGKTVHDHAIETFISSKIAEALFTKFSSSGATVALEVPFFEIARDSSAERRGTVNSLLPKRSRFDVVYFEGGRPVGLIEVKKRFSPAVAESDVRRLSEAVRRYGSAYGGSVRFGLWLALQRVGENSRRTSDKQIEDFRARFEWAIEPTFWCKPLDGHFGELKRQHRKVVEVRAFAAFFASG